MKENRQPVIYRPYVMSEARLNELMVQAEPVYKGVELPMDAGVSIAIPSRVRGVGKDIEEVRQKWDLEADSVGVWESPEEKQNTVLRTIDLMGRFKIDPENIALNREVNDMQEIIMERDTRLIFWTAARFGLIRRLPNDVILQEGRRGIVRSLEKYDPGRGTRFTTYEVRGIRSVVNRALYDYTNAITIPHNKLELMSRCLRAQEIMIHQLGCHVSMKEVLQNMGESPEKIELILGLFDLRRSLSLDSPLRKEDKITLADRIKSNASYTPEAAVERDDLKREFQNMLVELGRNEIYGKDSLTFHEITVLDKRFGLTTGTELDYEAIGEELGISRRAVKALEKRALGKIRRSSYAQRLREYLIG